MRSDKQIQAARENGAKSRGPKTPEGKAHSSQNATKHGFLAKTLLLPNEDQSDFEAIAASYIAKFQPEGPVETHLVEELIACYWRQRRAWGMETSLLDDEMTRLNPQIAQEFQQIDECSRAAQAWKSLADTSHSLQLLTRYEASLHRRYLRAIKTLTELQTARKAAEAEPKTENHQTNPLPPQPQPLQSLPEQPLAPNDPIPTNPRSLPQQPSAHHDSIPSRDRQGVGHAQPSSGATHCPVE